MSSTRPSLAALWGKDAGSTRAADALMESVRDLVDTVKKQKAMEPAVAVVREALHGTVEPAVDTSHVATLIKTGIEVARDRETRQKEAEAARAQAEVEAQRVQNEAQLGAANVAMQAIEKITESARGGALTPEGLAAIISAVKGGSGGFDLAGLAALITALQPVLTAMLNRPQDSGVKDQVSLLMRQIEKLEDRLERGTAGGAANNVDQLLGGLERLQKLTGTSPDHSLAHRRLDMEERLSAYEIRQREETKRAEHQYNGETLGLFREFISARPWEPKAPAAGGNGAVAAPAVVAAPPAVERFQIRCPKCQARGVNTLIPVEGPPPEALTCPVCGETLVRPA